MEVERGYWTYDRFTLDVEFYKYIDRIDFNESNESNECEVSREMERWMEIGIWRWREGG